MSNHKLVGEVRIEICFGPGDPDVTEDRIKQFAEMGKAVAEIATASKDMNVSRFVNGAGVTCNHGGFISIVVTDDPMWTNEHISAIAKELGERVYAKLGTSLAAVRQWLVDIDCETTPVVRWYWNKKWPSNEPKHEYVAAA